MRLGKESVISQSKRQVYLKRWQLPPQKPLKEVQAVPIRVQLKGLAIAVHGTQEAVRCQPLDRERN